MTPDERKKVLARNLRNARHYRGLSILDVIEKTQWNWGSTLMNAFEDEESEASPPFAFVVELAELYCVDFAWLVGESHFVYVCPKQEETTP